MLMNSMRNSDCRGNTFSAFWDGFRMDGGKVLHGSIIDFDPDV